MKIRLLLALCVAMVFGSVLTVAQVALSRLDCVNQASTRLLVNDSTDWTEYPFDASMLLNEDAQLQLYVVRLAPHARLVVCVG